MKLLIRPAPEVAIKSKPVRQQQMRQLRQNVRKLLVRLDSDIDGSGDVGLLDLVILCEYWLSPGDLSTGDLDGSGTTDFLDFAEFADAWLTQ